MLRDAGLLALLVLPAASRAADDEAKAKFDAAETAFDLGEFDKARRLYAEAYELEPLPGLLFNIGQCHRKLGEWTRAGFFYRRYLARLPEGTDTAKLEGLISEMDARGAAPPPSSRDGEPPQKPHSTAPRLTPVLSVEKPAPVPAAPPLVVREPAEPAYKQWWVWAGAGAATAATAVAIVAVGMAASSGAGSANPPRYGKLDAR